MPIPSPTKTPFAWRMSVDPMSVSMLAGGTFRIYPSSTGIAVVRANPNASAFVAFRITLMMSAILPRTDRSH